MANAKERVQHRAIFVPVKPYEPLLLGSASLLVMWLLLLWMYRRKLFLRI
ncbi:hypothetical protein CfE428DRAFT_4198 [Chthoniobacter flavus Ellin428]|uniref:Uncharacterized protein n=1 Tax=Chthoniobacter flavus Ellin428 TaxID=497964 RepID=B4D5K9_9BACT|nr:hypothetical protein CfE428DRAFT_4198 [Chthoniobacter flavus Ellin428]TCO90878.1 hypothetical protein EV701_10927 [Chthoniobacter flavus]